MLDKNRAILFMYRCNNDDLEQGLVSRLEHSVGRELASIEDVIYEDSQSDELYMDWGADGEYLIVKEGIYDYNDGCYILVSKF